ncbi:hypothetical protein B0H15DRAFT_872277 [Mycena belliarum]|uniref:F-box domain-containing protein n=1 Tax=Mycena belliarum TaxID=1033014 RepID=A0AAD6TN65_9AGAR|nr:hypothetical protein B0H15DRAFT_872277 [Mycena belliae]
MTAISTQTGPREPTALDGIEASTDSILERQIVRAELDTIRYPVLTLPPGITSHIFLHCLPTQPEASPSPSRTPILLTHVCHDWRYLALALPFLWQSLTLKERHKKSARDNLELLALWLERSGNLPISLRFHCRDAQSLVDASLPHSHRWRELEIKSSAHIDGSQAFPELRRVIVARSQEYAPRPVNILDAPRLREATVDGFLDVPDVSLPWGQLESLTILARVGAFSIGASILRQCSSLRALTRLGFVVGDEAAAWSEPHVTLSALHALDAHYSALPFLTCPSLQQLSLSGRPVVPSMVSQLEAFMARSSFRLQRLALRLGETNLDPEDVRLWHRIFPAIASLALVEPLDYRALGAISPDMFPALEHLAVRVHRIRVRNNCAPLFDFLRTRRSPTSAAKALKTLELSFYPDSDGAPSFASPLAEPLGSLLPAPAVAELRALAAGGLQLRIGVSDFRAAAAPRIILDTFLPG